MGTSIDGQSMQRVGLYVHAVNPLLKSYATDFNFGKATSDVASIKIDLMEILVQFAGVLRLVFVRSENAYSEERTRVVLVDSSPPSIKNALRMFWAHERDMRLLKTT